MLDSIALVMRMTRRIPMMYSRKYTNGVEANGLAKMFRSLGPDR